ncbi:MAG TPA: N-6 DNA methylase [Trebonia sp.]|nr:N-6 DNA methylase [Trebonia sp.]
MHAALHATLWKAADRLRGSMDAAQYKDYVLSLVFLRCMGGDASYATLASEVASAPDQAGVLVAAAMDELAAARPQLAGVVPPLPGGGLDSARLAGLIALIAELPASGDPRDLLGEVYEYFLGQFARAEGKRAGEFYTPASVVTLLVEMLEPFSGRVYDPCCGSGGMFVQAEKFVLAHHGQPGAIRVFGQESNQRTWRLARMNLAIHQVPGDLGERPADTFAADQHPDVRADFILANPPFNMSSWAREVAGAWPYGVPPAGNANFAWLQLIAGKLAPGGRAAVVLANGSLSSRQSGEGEIRAALVEAGMVSCVVALPAQLFRTTPIPACLWLLEAGDPGEILLIDARHLGTMADRTERFLADADIATIAGAYRGWRQARATGAAFADVPGFCKSVPLAEIRHHEHVLTPGRYVGAPAPASADDEPAGDRVERLTKELLTCFEESARLEQVVRSQIEIARNYSESATPPF